MNSSVVSIPFLALLTVILVGYFLVTGSGRKTWLQRQGGGVFSAARTVFSAPAFLVPTLMGGVALFVLAMSIGVGGQNPFLASDEDVFVHIGSIVIVALCLAGHIGLLEARRHGRSPGSEDFLEGVRQHGWTFVAAKVAWTAAILIPYGNGFSYRTRFLLSPDDAESIWFYLTFLAPSLFLAPVLTTATHYPGQPLRAIGASVLFAMRHPWSVARILLLQFGVAALGCAILCAGFESITFALTNGSPLGFQLFPYIPIARSGNEADILATVILGLTAPVFLTSYWSLSNGSLAAVPVSSLLRQKQSDVGRA